MVDQLMNARLEVGKPKVLNLRGLLIIWSFGLFLFLPVLFSLLVVSLMPLGQITILLPAFALALTAFFIPFGQGNFYISRKVRSLAAPDSDGESYVVQLTLFPRIHRGVRALVEDADDVGLLTFRSDAVIYQGDAVQVFFPDGSITEVRGKNVGARGRYVAGGRIVVQATGLGNIETVEFAERGSLLLPQTSKITMRVFEKLRKRVSPSANEK